MEPVKERLRQDFFESGDSVSTVLNINEESEFAEHGELCFEGFSEKQELWVRKLLESSGLPLDRIKLIRTVSGIHRPIVGRFLMGRYTHKTQTITIYPDGIIRTITGPFRNVSYTAYVNALVRTIVHEIAHASNPTYAHDAHSIDGSEEISDHLIGYEKIYSAEDADRLHETTKKKAEESLSSRIYLNAYHRRLAERVLLARRRKDIVKATHTFFRLCVELESIIVQFRYLNSEHIHQVDAATQKKLGRDARANYTSYFDWGNDIVGSATKSDAAGVEQKVIAFQRFVKTEPFPFD